MTGIELKAAESVRENRRRLSAHHKKRIRTWRAVMLTAPLGGILLASHAVWVLSQPEPSASALVLVMGWTEFLLGLSAAVAVPVAGMLTLRRLRQRMGLVEEEAHRITAAGTEEAPSKTVRERADRYKENRGIALEPEKALEDVKTGRRTVELRKRLGGLIFRNPVLKRELLSSMRADTGFALQFVFLALLSLVVFIAWPDRAMRENLANRDLLTFDLFRLFGQGELILIAIMGPAFSAATMTAEKERRTLDLLLTAPVSRHTVLVGKYLVSLAFLLLFIVSSLPIVSTVLWLPGVGPERIVSMFVILPCIAMFVTMIGLTASVHLDRSQASLAVSFAVVLPLGGILLILTFNDWFFGPGGAFLITVGTLPAIGWMYLKNYRRLARPFSRVRTAAAREEKKELELNLDPDKRPLDRLFIPPPLTEPLADGSNPVVAKEYAVLLGRGTGFLRWVILVTVLVCILGVPMIAVYEYVYAWFLAAFAVFLTPAFACTAFTHEREYGTAEMLMTTLLTPLQVIAGKWWVAFRTSFFIVMLPGVFLVILYPVLGFNESFAGRVLNMFGYLAVLSATVALLVTLSMAAGLVFRSTVGAMLASYTFVLAAFVLPTLAAQIIRVYLKAPMETVLRIQITSPFAALYTLGNRYYMLRSGKFLPTDIPFHTWPFYLSGCVVLTALLLVVVRLRFHSLGEHLE